MRGDASRSLRGRSCRCWLMLRALTCVLLFRFGLFCFLSDLHFENCVSIGDEEALLLLLLLLLLLYLGNRISLESSH